MAKLKTAAAAAPGRSLGAEIDALWALDEVVGRATAALKAANEAYDAAETALLARVKRSELNGAAGALARVEVKTTPLPRIVDYVKFTAWVHRHKAYELFEKRVARAAFAERGGTAKVPGTDTFDRVGLRLTALKLKK